MQEPIKTREHFEAELIRCGLGEWSDRILDMAQRAVRFDRRPVTADADIPVGASKLGGCPDLPRDIEWPHREAYDHFKRESGPEFPGKNPLKKLGISVGLLRSDERKKADWERSEFGRRFPLTFVAQFNLGEIAALGDLDLGLPGEGQLLIFYDVGLMPWGFDPREKCGFKLLWVDSAADDLVRRQAPDELRDLETGSFSPVRLEPYHALSAPSCLAQDIDELGLPGELLDIYEEELRVRLDGKADAQGTYGGSHKLRGWPDEVQGDMRLQAQLVSHGLYCGDGDAFNSQEVRRLESGAADWTLVAQIDSDDDAGMVWGDAGSVYVWIHKDDLEACRFEKALLILQCC